MPDEVEKNWTCDFPGLISTFRELYYSALLLSACKKISYPISLTQESNPSLFTVWSAGQLDPWRTRVFLFMKTWHTARDKALKHLMDVREEGRSEIFSQKSWTLSLHFGSDCPI